jgi:uncharacterized protein involved in cysteine biosynthesis
VNFIQETHMADLLVILVSAAMMVQVGLIGAALFFGAVSNDVEYDQTGAAPYDPMAILTARSARKVAGFEQRKAA